MIERYPTCHHVSQRCQELTMDICPDRDKNLIRRAKISFAIRAGLVFKRFHNRWRKIIMWSAIERSDTPAHSTSPWLDTRKISSSELLVLVMRVGKLIGWYRLWGSWWNWEIYPWRDGYHWIDWGLNHYRQLYILLMREGSLNLREEVINRDGYTTRTIATT